MKFLSKMFMVLWLLPVIANAQTVRMETVLGNIDIQLHPSAAPATVTNFLSYVNGGDYDNSIIHRNVVDFIVQGGGVRFVGGQAFLIPVKPAVINEYELPNVRGTISMAKPANDPNGARNQWFFNTIDNTDVLGPDNAANAGSGGFTVFGTVISGMEVVDAMNSLPTSTSSNPINVNINGVTSSVVGVPYLSGNPDILEESNAVILTKVYALNDTLNINPGLNGAWFNPNTPGQGFLFEVLPTLDSVFMAWFTYDTQAPTDTAVVGFAGHRWMTSLGSIDHENNTVTFDLFVTSNGLFDNNQAVDTSEANSVGTLIITFDDCENATGVYDLIEQELTGSFDMVRITGDNVPLCESLSQAAAK